MASAQTVGQLEDEVKAAKAKLADLLLQIAVEQGTARAIEVAESTYDSSIQTVAAATESSSKAEEITRRGSSESKNDTVTTAAESSTRSGETTKSSKTLAEQNNLGTLAESSKAGDDTSLCSKRSKSREILSLSGRSVDFEVYSVASRKSTKSVSSSRRSRSRSKGGELDLETSSVASRKSILRRSRSNRTDHDSETCSVASRRSITSKSIAGSVAYSIDSHYRTSVSVHSNLSQKEMRFIYDKEHDLNNDLMQKLAKKMEKHNILKSSDRNALKSHWQYKSTRLHMQCMRFKKNRTKQIEAIKELEDYKRIQMERIASLQYQPSKLFTGASPFAKRATFDPSFCASLERIVNSSEEKLDLSLQIREEAKIELLALEECLAILDNERGKDSLGPKKELVVVKAILDFTDDQLSGSEVYQLTCMGCQEQMGFVGITEMDLKTSIDMHIEQVVKAVRASSGKSKFSVLKKLATGSKGSQAAKPTPPEPTKGSKPGKGAPAKKSKSDGPDKREAWSKDFAAHVARHIKPKSKFKSASEEEIWWFCRENLKVEVLQRKYGGQLHWEDQKDVLS